MHCDSNKNYRNTTLPYNKQILQTRTTLHYVTCFTIQVNYLSATLCKLIYCSIFFSDSVVSSQTILPLPPRSLVARWADTSLVSQTRPPSWTTWKTCTAASCEWQAAPRHVSRTQCYGSEVDGWTDTPCTRPSTPRPLAGSSTPQHATSTTTTVTT